MMINKNDLKKYAYAKLDELDYFFFQKALEYLNTSIADKIVPRYNDLLAFDIKNEKIYINYLSRYDVPDCLVLSFDEFIKFCNGRD